MIIGGLYAFLWGNSKELHIQSLKFGHISSISKAIPSSQSLSKETIVDKDVSISKDIENA